MVRVPEPTGTGTGGVSAERVRAQLGADVSTTGGPVVVASRAAAGGGVVMSPEQATTLARELGRDVVVLAPGRGRRGPRWMRFSANGGRPKPAADGVVVRPSEPDTSPTAPRTDLGSLAHASTAVPETAKPTTPATGSEDAAGPEALETAAVGADLGGPGRPVAGSEPATRGEVSDADGPAMPAGAESGVEDGSVDSVTAEAGSGVGDTSAESVSTASTSRPEPGRSESAGAVDARKEAVRIVRDTHDPVKLARSPEVVSVDEVIERIAALVREHGPAWARQYSQELADELGTAGRAYGIRGGAGPEPTAQPGNQSGGSGLRRRGAVRGRVGNRLHPDNQPVVPHSTPPAQPPGSDARGHEEAQPPDVQDVNAGTRGDDPSRLTGPLDAPHVGDAGPVVDLSSLGEPSLGRDWRPADSQRGDASGSGDPFVDLSSLDGMPQSLAARASGTDVAGPNESGGSEQDSRTVQAESESEPASPIVGDHDGDPGSPVSPLDPDDSRPLWPSVDRGTGVSRGERSPEHEESLDVDLTQFAGEPPALYQGEVYLTGGSSARPVGGADGFAYPIRDDAPQRPVGAQRYNATPWQDVRRWYWKRREQDIEVSREMLAGKFGMSEDEALRAHEALLYEESVAPTAPPRYDSSGRDGWTGRRGEGPLSGRDLQESYERACLLLAEQARLRGQGAVAGWFADAEHVLGSLGASETFRVLMAHHFMANPNDWEGAWNLRGRFLEYMARGVSAGAGPEPGGEGSRSSEETSEEERQEMLARLKELADPADDGVELDTSREEPESGAETASRRVSWPGALTSEQRSTADSAAVVTADGAT
ncbi:hypothetical protein, partial [Saccharopolyspora erythraea]|uniref:hypothetical protein n=1 Tax=Saccharopolyspora erythraea TaxID=1836 RepID=UPI001EE64484